MVILLIIIGVVLLLVLSSNNRALARKSYKGRSNYRNNNTNFGSIDSSQDCNIIIDNDVYNTSDNNCDCGCASDDGGSCDCYSGDSSSCDCGGCNDCGGDSGSSSSD